MLLTIIGAAAFSSAPAIANPWVVAPYFGFGFGFNGPYPYYSPWYGPRVGVGVHVGTAYPRRAAPAPQQPQQGALKLYIYPAAGQSDSQTADDRYQCHLWAADQSGHDPTLGAGSRGDAENYTRAFTACMEARDYVVK